MFPFITRMASPLLLIIISKFKSQFRLFKLCIHLLTIMYRPILGNCCPCWLDSTSALSIKAFTMTIQCAMTMLSTNKAVVIRPIVCLIRPNTVKLTSIRLTTLLLTEVPSVTLTTTLWIVLRLTFVVVTILTLGERPPTLLSIDIPVCNFCKLDAIFRTVFLYV